LDKARIKNFIIIVLVLVNAFLLLNVISSAKEQWDAQDFRVESLKKVLSDNGITLDSDIELPDSVPPLLSLKRDMEAEYDSFKALIGNCTVLDLGGNVFYYEGIDGQAKSRGTGDFEMKLNSGVVNKGRDPVYAAKSAMKKLGIECSSAEPVIAVEGENVTVTLCCAWDGVAVYSAKINFYFYSDNLLIISGTRPLQEENTVSSSENYPDAVTVLMGFLESSSQSGYVCSEISDLQVEYSMYSAVSGYCTLKPVWCIQTNSGSYYIDAETGIIENISSAS